MIYLDQYQKQAAKTAVFPDYVAVPYLALGLTSEAGEVAGKIKKHLRGDNNPDVVNDIRDELGDVLWYLAVLANYLDISLDEVADRNLKKLADRMERGVIKGDGDKR